MADKAAAIVAWTYISLCASIIIVSTAEPLLFGSRHVADALLPFVSAFLPNPASCVGGG